MRISIPFSLDHDSDKDIIEYLDGMSSIARNMHIRQAIRDHIAIERNKTTMKDIYTKLDQLITRLESSLESIGGNVIRINEKEYDLNKYHYTKSDIPEGKEFVEPHKFADYSEIISNIDSVGED